MYKHTVSSQAERRLKIEQQAGYITSQLLLTTDAQVKASYEAELSYLRIQYANTLPDAVIQERCNRLAELRKTLNLTTVDNRAAYQQKAISKLCGVAA